MTRERLPEIPINSLGDFKQHILGEPKPDRPDREKIARILYFDFEEFEVGSVAEVTWREGSQRRRDKWLKKADQILALIPDEDLLITEDNIGGEDEGIVEETYKIPDPEQIDAMLVEARRTADQKGYYRGVGWATKIAEDTLNKVFKAHELEMEEAKKQERERIIEWLQKHNGYANLSNSNIEDIFISFKDMQDLKGE